jgi:hypothetical protein
MGRKMAVPTDNETWVIEAGDDIIHKKAKAGVASLTPKERLIYCLWVADYGMRNAGDLGTASDVYQGFQKEGAEAAKSLSLNFAHATFTLPEENFQREYFARFERLCDEIKKA